MVCFFVLTGLECKDTVRVLECFWEVSKKCGGKFLWNHADVGPRTPRTELQFLQQQLPGNRKPDFHFLRKSCLKICHPHHHHESSRSIHHSFVRKFISFIDYHPFIWANYSDRSPKWWLSRGIPPKNHQTTLIQVQELAIYWVIIAPMHHLWSVLPTFTINLSPFMQVKIFNTFGAFG